MYIIKYLVNVIDHRARQEIANDFAVFMFFQEMNEMRKLIFQVNGHVRVVKSRK